MVQIDLSSALAAAMAAVLLCVALLWLLQPAKAGRPKGRTLDPRYVWVCSVCTYNYVNTREESMSTCPRCGSYNKR